MQRLDQDTTGLLLLTDDGQYLQSPTHCINMPKFTCTPADPVSAKAIQALEQGVELRKCCSRNRCTVQLFSEHINCMTVHQGVYHQGVCLQRSRK